MSKPGVEPGILALSELSSLDHAPTALPLPLLPPQLLLYRGFRALDIGRRDSLLEARGLLRGGQELE